MVIPLLYIQETCDQEIKIELFMPTHIAWSQTETGSNNQPTDLCDSLPVIDINKTF